MFRVLERDSIDLKGLTGGYVDRVSSGFYRDCIMSLWGFYRPQGGSRGGFELRA